MWIVTRLALTPKTAGGGDIVLFEEDAKERQDVRGQIVMGGEEANDTESESERGPRKGERTTHHNRRGRCTGLELVTMRYVILSVQLAANHSPSSHFVFMRLHIPRVN